MRISRPVVALALSWAMVACGNGGGGSSPNTVLVDAAGTKLTAATFEQWLLKAPIAPDTTLANSLVAAWIDTSLLLKALRDGPSIDDSATVDAAIAPDARLETVGVRPGEKLHEEMITDSDSLQTLEFERHYVIQPSMPLWDVEQYLGAQGGKRAEVGFSYNSGTNREWIAVEELRRLIREHVDPAFVPGCRPGAP